MGFTAFLPSEFRGIRKPLLLRRSRMELPVKNVFCHIQRIGSMSGTAVAAVFYRLT